MPVTFTISFNKRTILILALLVGLGVAIWASLHPAALGKRKSLEDKPQAVAALAALKKLKAKTEAGIPYRDYRNAVGDTKFAVDQFLESDDAIGYPEFASALKDSMKWYQAASQTWSIEIESPRAFYSGCHWDETVKEWCKAYPEIVQTDPDGRVHDSLALDEAWLFASFSVDNAGLAMRGKPVKDAEAFHKSWAPSPAAPASTTSDTQPLRSGQTSSSKSANPPKPVTH